MSAGRAPLWPAYVATFTFMLGQWAAGLAVPLHVGLLGGSLADVGLLGSVRFGLQTFLQLPFGAVADAWGTRRVLLLAIVGNGFVNLIPLAAVAFDSIVPLYLSWRPWCWPGLAASPPWLAPIDAPTRLGAMRLAPVLVLSLVLSACAAVRQGNSSLDPTESPDPGPVTSVTCGGPGFPLSVLDAPGGAENGTDAAAEALRDHLATSDLEIDWLPDTGWKEAVRTDDMVVFIAEALPGGEPSLVQVSVEHRDGSWRVGGWSGCSLQADVGPDLGLASFRVAPDVDLTPDMTEIEVLVTERACNSGEDASGRIEEPVATVGAESVTVVFAVRPRGGAQDCPSNPETPYVLVLDEPLGDRVLLDGSEVCPP
jgi:hypothetical protein